RYGFINARMVSDQTDMEARLVDYAEGIETHIGQFANAPIGAIALAVTGASYLLGREAEDALVERVFKARGLPLVTTALAVCDALTLLAARNITLISPYPETLTAKSVHYWTSRGFHIAELVQLSGDSDSFHPIYALPSDAASTALESVKDNGSDAIVMLGTGMPTLAPIAARAGWNGPPVLSSLFCLAWRSVAAAAGNQPDRGDLDLWLSAAPWKDALSKARRDQSL
ncbi:MAG: hypothetical protein HN732_15340, partial [Rhodospirillaceae bacterium]|nr:hypothetical protein [Rhodospirillaceae bacterium]